MKRINNFFTQLVLAWRKFVFVASAELLGLAVVRNHLFEKRKMSSFEFFRSSKQSILRCQDQNLARFFSDSFLQV